MMSRFPVAPHHLYRGRDALLTGRRPALAGLADQNRPASEEREGLFRSFGGCLIDAFWRFWPPGAGDGLSSPIAVMASRG
jgi:hypothetical protein